MQFVKTPGINVGGFKEAKRQYVPEKLTVAGARSVMVQTLVKA